MGCICDGRLADDAQLTLNYGVRYEFFAPYTEKYGHLADVQSDPTGRSKPLPRRRRVEMAAASLVYPFRVAFAPRVGLALRLPKATVVRAGFGMNYTVGEYGSFANKMAHHRW